MASVKNYLSVAVDWVVGVEVVGVGVVGVRVVGVEVVAVPSEKGCLWLPQDCRPRKHASGCLRPSTKASL